MQCWWKTYWRSPRGSLFPSVPMSPQFFCLCSLCNRSTSYLSPQSTSTSCCFRIPHKQIHLALYPAIFFFCSLVPRNSCETFFLSFYFIKAMQSDSSAVYILLHELVLDCSQSSFLTPTSGSAKMSPSRGQNIFMAAKMDSVVFIIPFHLSRSESKHTSASRKILAQVQEASRKVAADLEAKHSNSKVWSSGNLDSLPFWVLSGRANSVRNPAGVTFRKMKFVFHVLHDFLTAWSVLD